MLADIEAFSVLHFECISLGRCYVAYEHEPVVPINLARFYVRTPSGANIPGAQTQPIQQAV